VNPLKRSFYAACNSIFSHRNGISEIAVLNLQEAYSLSVLMYASPALAVQSKQIKELNACWNVDISFAIVLLKYGTSCHLIPTSAVLTSLHVHLLALTFLIIVTIITSLHYILFLCNFMALLKRLICSAIANEPTTDMMFLSSTS